jgi:hypothetical protein
MQVREVLRNTGDRPSSSSSSQTIHRLSTVSFFFSFFFTKTVHKLSTVCFVFFFSLQVREVLRNTGDAPASLPRLWAPLARCLWERSLR